MDEQQHPRTMGVFKPTGHVVMVLPTAEDADDLLDDLQLAAFGDEAISRYNPEQMEAQVAHDLAAASPLAHFGQEMNLLRTYGELAGQGAHFIVVRAPGDDQARQVAHLASRHHALRATHYGRLIIEELIEPGTEKRQVFESPARGLDAQTPSGREQPR